MFIISIVFLVVGILVHKFEFYFLLSGYNMMTESQKSEIDAKAYGKFFGIHMYIISIMFLAIGFASTLFPNLEIVGIVGLFAVITHLIVKGAKYSRHEMTGESKYSLVILFVPMIIVAVVLSYSLKSVSFELLRNGLKVDSQTISLDEIKEVQIIDEAPEMRKVFGSGLGTHKKGTYEVEGFGECTVFTDVKYGDTLIIKTNEDTYILNSKEDGKIQSFYDSLKVEID